MNRPFSLFAFSVVSVLSVLSFAACSSDPDTSNEPQASDEAPMVREPDGGRCDDAGGARRCSPGQRFDETECRCLRSCIAPPACRGTMYWDPRACECVRLGSH